ncbi:putative lipoprotein with Yx(FWY)xxD motif [Catenulispora sp. GAS73]|uniref:COG4315 family predicted lipoprotein n=1 Tax=Catenulispora sp. GAS73 TaxID=3156269 RepID=UPI003516C974
MNRLIAVTAGVGAVAALAVGCGSSSSSSSSSKASSTPSSAPSSSSSTPAASAAVHTENSKYGQILVDGSGRTLYVLTADKGSTSSCYSTCAGIWPPDTTTGMPASSGVTASLVGTTARTDHTTQVTYNGHPLYTFSHDAKAGDVNGEGVATFGGIWYVVGTDGNAITAAPSSTPSAPAPSTSGGGYNY